MKYFLTITTFFIAGCATISQYPRITVSYDKFENHAIIKTFPPILVHSEHSNLVNLRSWASYVCEGDTSCKTENIFINFASESYRGWQYLTSHDLIFLVDNERMNFGETTHFGDSETDAGGVLTIEMMSAIIPKEQFRKIANAQVVEGKLGFTVFNIERKDRELFRMLLARADK